MGCDGSRWIVLFALLRNRTGAHDLCTFTNGPVDGSGWIGSKSVHTHSHSYPRLVHFHGWIGGWIVMDRDGSCCSRAFINIILGRKCLGARSTRALRQPVPVILPRRSNNPPQELPQTGSNTFTPQKSVRIPKASPKTVPN
jgi:hypothetical protein